MKSITLFFITFLFSGSLLAGDILLEAGSTIEIEANTNHRVTCDNGNKCTIVKDYKSGTIFSVYNHRDSIIETYKTLEEAINAFKILKQAGVCN